LSEITVVALVEPLGKLNETLLPASNQSSNVVVCWTPLTVTCHEVPNGRPVVVKVIRCCSW
jgi:hypothetical protein